MTDGARIALVSGGTGLVGGRLLPALGDAGWAVRALTRRPEGARLPGGAEAVGWDGTQPSAEALAGAEAVVHLSGEPVFNARLGAARRERVYTSRVDSTRALVRAIGALAEPERPRVLVCASAVGYYGSRGEEPLDEAAGPGSGFLADLCVAWEREAQAAASLGVRVVSLRIGVVMAREGGALPAIARVFRLGLGGRLGSGDQWFPWVHVDDVVGLIRLALDDARVRGALNAVGAEPVRNRELTAELARCVRRPAFFAVPRFAIRTALGDLSEELLGSRRVVPARAAELGYAFAHAELASALTAELERVSR
ncbi:MAG: TIGR01777 family oxidoreductase [Myxococcota bacterium]|nr:TIGR01777 family oxidoreductase [Myxococcota bacterium]